MSNPQVDKADYAVSEISEALGIIKDMSVLLAKVLKQHLWERPDDGGREGDVYADDVEGALESADVIVAELKAWRESLQGEARELLAAEIVKRRAA